MAGEEKDFEYSEEYKRRAEEMFETDCYDAHSCSAHADWQGVCQFCGAVVYGSYAYRELYGGE